MGRLHVVSPQVGHAIFCAHQTVSGQVTAARMEDHGGKQSWGALVAYWSKHWLNIVAHLLPSSISLNTILEEAKLLLSAEM